MGEGNTQSGVPFILPCPGIVASQTLLGAAESKAPRSQVGPPHILSGETCVRLKVQFIQSLRKTGLRL